MNLYGIKAIEKSSLIFNAVLFINGNQVRMDVQKILETIYEIRYLQERILLLFEHVHGKLNVEEEWLDNNDLCRLLKVTDKTLYRWRQSGKLAFAVVGGKYYYSKKNIDKLIAEHGLK